MNPPTRHDADAAAELRRRAEIRLQVKPPTADRPHVMADGLRLVHELQVQQIELELQNEELRDAHAEVEAALERYADFYDFSPVGFVTLERDGAIARLNLTGARLLGLERGRTIGKRFAGFVTEAGRVAFDAFLQRVFAGETRQSCELELAIEGVPSRTIQINATLSPDQQECRAVVVDVTERKQIERALRESERRFRDVADISADWIWEVDMAGRYSYVSESVRVLLGYAPDEIIGKTAFDLMPPDEALRVQKLFAAIVMRKESFRDLENIVLDSLGGRHDTLTNGTPVRDAAGQLIGYRGVDRDITQRRQVEQQLREMAEGLEVKVFERTAQLRRLSAQLTMTEERERRKLAQDLHDNLGQLLAVMKIKLTSISAGALQPLIDQVVALLVQAGRAVRTITQQLSPPVLHTLGLVPALQWLAEDIERVYSIVVHVDHDDCPCHLADEVQAVLYRAARELLINVAKHAGVGDASLSCLCNGGRLVLVVSDAGCGFEPADHLGSWPGYQNFGLRSIYERIANIGGEMEVDSSPGNGTTITLSTPCVVGEKEIHDDPHNAGR